MPGNGRRGLRRRRIVAGAEACQNFQKERYAIKNDTDIIALRQPEFEDDPLTEIARDGARRKLAAALRVEADTFVASHAEEILPDGLQRVVRHGHGPERSIQTGIGALAVRRPKVRDRAVPEGARPRGGRAGREEDPLYLRHPAENGRGARRASMPCCPCSICAASRRGTFRRRWPQSREGRTQPVARRDLAADRGMAAGMRPPAAP